MNDHILGLPLFGWTQAVPGVKTKCYVKMWLSSTCYKADWLSLFPRQKKCKQACKICGHLFLFLRKFSLFMDNGSTARKPNLHTGKHADNFRSFAHHDDVSATWLVTNGKTRQTSFCRWTNDGLPYSSWRTTADFPSLLFLFLGPTSYLESQRRFQLFRNYITAILLGIWSLYGTRTSTVWIYLYLCCYFPRLTTAPWAFLCRRGGADRKEMSPPNQTAAG